MDQGEDSTARIPSVLEDPSIAVIARRYAQAYIGALGDQDLQSSVEEYESLISDVFNQYPAFERLLASNTVSKVEKRNIVQRALQPVASEMLGKFLMVLASHDRLSLLRSISDELHAEVNKRMGYKDVILKTAHPLGDEWLQSLKQRLEQILSFQPVVISEVDETLIGGMVIKIGDTIYDGSLRTRMNQLRSKFSKRYVDEIQGRRDRFSTAEGN